MRSLAAQAESIRGLAAGDRPGLSGDSSWWMRIRKIAKSREFLRRRICRPLRRKSPGPITDGNMKAFLGLTIQKKPRRPSPMHMWLTTSDRGCVKTRPHCKAAENRPLRSSQDRRSAPRQWCRDPENGPLEEFSHGLGRMRSFIFISARATFRCTDVPSRGLRLALEHPTRGEADRGPSGPPVPTLGVLTGGCCRTESQIAAVALFERESGRDLLPPAIWHAPPLC